MNRQVETPESGNSLALRRLIVPIAAFSAAVNVLMLTGSIYMLQVYDRVLSSGSVPTLMGLFVIVVALYAFLGLFDGLRMRLLSRIGLRLDAALGARAFRADLARPGALRDLETIRTGISSPAATALLDLPFVPLFLGCLFLLHPLIGWLTVAGALVGAALALLTRALTARATGRAAEADAAERAFAEAGRRAREAVEAMGMAGRITAQWRRLRNRNLAASQGGSDPAETLAATSRSFRMLLQSGILTLGAWLVLAGEITAGMIIASSILSGRALGPIDQIAGQWRTIGQVLAAKSRLKQALATEPEEARPLDLPRPEGRLKVTGLSRLMPARPGLPAERAPILDKLDFALEPGDGLGVIGASASGKTTLARLLVGALAPDAGEVRLGGATLDQWSPTRRGAFIGYLPQRVEMLPGTIRDNIARFDPEATDAAVIEAARLAGVHEMILKLPEGYATRVGEASGAALSGGQIQRLGLARAVFGTPALVVLDEPNAHLDVAGESALTQAVQALRDAGTAVVVMAHRKSALEAVNRLMILEAGRIAALGPRDEVLELARTGQAAALLPAAEDAPAAIPAPGRPAALAPPVPDAASDPASAPTTRGKPPAAPALPASEMAARVLDAARRATASRDLGGEEATVRRVGPAPDRRPRVLRLEGGRPGR